MENESNGKIIYKFIPQKGKGLAIRESWKSFDADFYVFMDADLATDLSTLPILVKELENGNDLVIGSRFIKGSSAKKAARQKNYFQSFQYSHSLGVRIQDKRLSMRL